jgi:hypothetical protein
VSLRLSRARFESGVARDRCRCARPCEAVEFYFMQPLRARRSLLDQLGKLRRYEAWKGELLRRDGPDLTAPEASA